MVKNTAVAKRLPLSTGLIGYCWLCVACTVMIVVSRLSHSEAVLQIGLCAFGFSTGLLLTRVLSNYLAAHTGKDYPLITNTGLEYLDEELRKRYGITRAGVIESWLFALSSLLISVGIAALFLVTLGS